MNDDKLCISPDALIAMIVTEAQDRALAQMSGPEAAGDVQPSDAFLRKWTRWSAIPGARPTESGICGRPSGF